MNGAHDIGGKPGYGPVIAEQNEPVFHAPWEAIVSGLQRAVALATVNKSSERRYAIERMDSDHYRNSSYYERWLVGTATLAVEYGLVTSDELEQRAQGNFPLSRPAWFSSEFADTVVESVEPQFPPGTLVKVKNLQPLGHCRCPEYVRGSVGVVTGINGSYPLPDLVALRMPAKFDFCYNVEFSAADLFDDSDPSVKIRIDLFEAYLEFVI